MKKQYLCKDFMEIVNVNRQYQKQFQCPLFFTSNETSWIHQQLRLPLDSLDWLFNDTISSLFKFSQFYTKAARVFIKIITKLAKPHTVALSM